MITMNTLERVLLKRKSLDDYRPIVGNEAIDAIRDVAAELKGVRLLHLNSAASGGGVAELLNSVAPLECDCGLDVEWKVLARNDRFFQVTKKFHNALQGMEGDLSPEDRETYLRESEEYAAWFSNNYDAVIVHDPQPAALPSFLNNRGETRWIWRCHIDTSQPNQAFWSFLSPFVQQYDAAVFTMPEFAPPDFSGPKLAFIPPAIDPLTPKNRALPKYLAREEVSEFGIDLGRPLLIQVSRFDPWKDPQGVIETYRLVKKAIPEIQLALIGAMAEDDPQGWEIYGVIRREADKDPDLYAFTNLTGVGAHEVNAFQRCADVVIQKSIREGFGLVVSEALWKGTPVVAGNTGGIRLQLQYEVGGFLIDTIEEAAERIIFLLTHSDASEAIARRGWERVRERFLTPRLVFDQLKLVRELLSRGE